MDHGWHHALSAFCPILSTLSPSSLLRSAPAAFLTCQFLLLTLLHILLITDKLSFVLQTYCRVSEMPHHTESLIPFHSLHAHFPQVHFSGTSSALKVIKLHEMLDLNRVCWLDFIHSSLHFIHNFNLSLCLILGFRSCPFLSRSHPWCLNQILNSQSSVIFKKAQQKPQFIWTLWTFSLSPDLINIFETAAGSSLQESETSNVFVTFKLGN